LITELMRDPEGVRRTGENARSLARPGAAKAIVDEMLKEQEQR
jgi:hypothetical protein